MLLWKQVKEPASSRQAVPKARKGSSPRGSSARNPTPWLLEFGRRGNVRERVARATARYVCGKSAVLERNMSDNAGDLNGSTQH